MGNAVNRFRLAVAALAALTLAACYPPTTTHPIGTSSGLKPDPMLAGLWKGKAASGGEDGAYFHFLQQHDGSITAILVQAGNQPDGDWNLVTLTTARVGANRIMNARMISSNGKPETDAPAGTIPVLYRITTNGRLTLYMMDETAVKAAITAGKIKGTIEKGSLGDVAITADPVELDAFMASGDGRALFTKPFFVLRKMD